MAGMADGFCALAVPESQPMRAKAETAKAAKVLFIPILLNFFDYGNDVIAAALISSLLKLLL